MVTKKMIDLVEKAEIFTRKNSPIILTGMAIVGVLSTAYLSYKAGPRAEKILETYRRDMKDCHPKDKEAKRAVAGEAVKKMIPVLTPPVVMGGVTIACIAGSHSVSSRRMVALSTAYTLSESTVKNLNGKMEEMLGEKKARAVKDAIMKDKLKSDNDGKTPPESQIILTGDGTHLCKDLYSGRFFRSNAQKINQAIAKLSYAAMSEMYIQLNEFYEEIGLEMIPMGNDLGWNIDDLQCGKLPIVITALLTEEQEPCLCIDYDVSVRADLGDFHRRF